MVRWLLLCVAAAVAIGAQSQHVFDDVALIENIDKPTLAVEANEPKEEDKRAINGDSDQQAADGKFQVYVGTIDGVRRILFNEVDGGDDAVPAETAGGRDMFGAYDDNTVIDPNQERGIFIPRPYRPKEERDKDTTTEKPPTTPFRTLPPAPTTQRTTPRPPPLPTAPPQPAAPFRPQPIPQSNFQQRPPQNLQPLPQVPQQPPRVQQPFVSQTQRTRRPPPFAPPQPTPAPQSFRPVQPIQPFPPQPQQPFRPVPQQQSFQQPQQPQQSFQQPQQPFQQAFQRPQQGFRQPQQPFQSQFQQPFQQPFQPQTRPTQPPPPPPPPTTTTPAPQPPFQQNRGGDLRSGVCPASIFYISTPLTGPSRLSFTHFAIAVTVDQCARTCHEFNCAIAHYNPVNGHCEFNPSTAFAIRNGQCPAWPSLHYRNNVVASESVRIFCVTCQRPRRRDPNRARNRFQLRQRVFDPRRPRSQRRPRNEASSVPVIHGVLLRQPNASTGLSTSSFVGLTSNGETKARAARTVEVSGAQSVEVSPLEVEEGDAIMGKSRASGVSTRQADSPIALE